MSFLFFIRCIKSNETLKGAMDILETEIVPWDDPSEASPEYRIQLTKSLLYKVRVNNNNTFTNTAQV